VAEKKGGGKKGEYGSRRTSFREKGESAHNDSLKTHLRGRLLYNWEGKITHEMEKGNQRQKKILARTKISSGANHTKSCKHGKLNAPSKKKVGKKT